MDILSYHTTPFTQEKIDLIRTNVPQEIRDMPCWCYFKSEFNIEKSKYEKKPCNFSGYDADWRPAKYTFEDLAKKPNKCVTGVGIVIHPDCVVAWDIDHCLDNGKLHDDNIISDLMRINSYTEVSPSATGLHVLFKAEKPEWVTRVKGGPYELYFKNHFITITGYIGKGVNRPLRPVEIDDIKQIYQRIDPNVDFRTASDLGLTEEQFLRFKEDERKIIEILNRKNQVANSKISATEFSKKKPNTLKKIGGTNDEVRNRLLSYQKSSQFYAGNWQGVTNSCGMPYQSQSEADLAFCKLIAIQTGYNREQTDEIFRESGMFRPEKWDRSVGNGKTYGESTLDCAFRR